MLSIRNLSVSIGPHQIVSIDELDLPHGRRLGMVGESGSGKTMTAMSIVGLQPRDARVAGSINFDGRELVGLTDRQLANIRGAQIGVVFQDPLRALNPTMRVGKQIAEAVRLHANLARAQRNARVVDLMAKVRLPDPDNLIHRYPHQLSGGQQQRVLIAIAIAGRPKLLIADEPTTALDVTVQKGILDLLLQLSDDHQMALLFVSHNLGVVRTVSDQIAVLYGGQLIESGPSHTIIGHPRHRYTEALIAANPGQVASEDLDALIGRRLATIAGSVPAPNAFPSGCRFRDRCPHAVDTCAANPPTTHLDEDHRFKCWNPAGNVRGELHAAAH